LSVQKRLMRRCSVSLTAGKLNHLKKRLFIKGFLRGADQSRRCDVEFRGVEREKILDFGPMGSVRRLRNGSRAFRQSEPDLQGIGHPSFPSLGHGGRAWKDVEGSGRSSHLHCTSRLPPVTEKGPCENQVLRHELKRLPRDLLRADWFFLDPHGGLP